MRVYDCRHAAATTWIRAGVPIGEVAKRMGHGVETLVSTYIGALTGDETVANERIDAAMVEFGTAPAIQAVSGGTNAADDSDRGSPRRSGRRRG